MNRLPPLVYVPVPKSMRFGVLISRRLRNPNYPELFPTLFIRVYGVWKQIVGHFSGN